jgi:hypothetical protein
MMLDLSPLDIKEYRVVGAAYFWEEARTRKPMCYHVGLAGSGIMEIWK